MEKYRWYKVSFSNIVSAYPHLVKAEVVMRWLRKHLTDELDVVSPFGSRSESRQRFHRYIRGHSSQKLVLLEQHLTP